MEGTLKSEGTVLLIVFDFQELTNKLRASINTKILTRADYVWLFITLARNVKL